MSTSETPSDRRVFSAGRALRCSLGVLGISLLLMAPVGAGVPPASVVPTIHTPIRHEFPPAFEVYELASVGKHVLVIDAFANGSYDLVMFDPSFNASAVVEPVNPPGTFPSGIGAGGGGFVVGWVNATTGQTHYQSVTTGGVVKALALVTPVPWSFPYGNATALFATYSDELWQVNPHSLAIVHNYSGKLPYGVTIASVLPVGARLYVSGSEQASNVTTSPFFGFLNRTSHVFHSLTKPSTTFPPGLEGGFLSMYQMTPNVYLAGADTYSAPSTFSIRPVAGLFYDYNATTGRLANLSGLLPHANWGAYALVPWHGKVAISLNDYVVNLSAFSGVLAGGLYSYTPGAAKLTNLTSWWGPKYLADVSSVTTETGGVLTSGGQDVSTGNAEVVSIVT